MVATTQNSGPDAIAHREWARYTSKQRWLRFGAMGLVALAVVWSLSTINVIWPWLWDAPQQMGDLFGRMFPPSLEGWKDIAWTLLETINIATIATFFAVFLSLPIALISAQNTTPNHHLGLAVCRGIRPGCSGRYSRNRVQIAWLPWQVAWRGD